MDSKRNGLVDVTRMICAILVVAIHTNLGKENELTWILFQTIARIAVPYFLVVTGWFFYQNTLKNHRAIFKYIMNLLRAYLIASIPFAVVFVIRNNKSGTFFRELLVALLWKGMSTHLWYFPATILALVVCWLIIKATRNITGNVLIYIGWGANLICSVCDIYSHAFGFECVWGGGTRTYCGQPYTPSPIF